MKPFSGHAHRGKSAFAAFLLSTLAIFFLSLNAASSVGFVPYYIDGTPSPRADRAIALADLPELSPSTGSEQVPSENPLAASEVKPTNPARIVIGSVEMDLPVQNIASKDIDVLYEHLKDGPIRYVDSARLGEEGNVLIFGHSSRLPVVHNQMYKAFNRVPELKAGNVITLRGEDGKSYLYTVTDVRTADARDAVIDLSRDKGRKLTLVTCDTLTGETARFIAEAEFVGVVE